MITRKELTDEQRRIDQLRRDGKTEQFIRSWLRGWRSVKPTNK